MKVVEEDVYQALLVTEITTVKVSIKWCYYTENVKQERVGRQRYEKFPNVVPVTTIEDESNLAFLIRRILQEEVHLLVVNQTHETSDLHYTSLEEFFQKKRKMKRLSHQFSIILLTLNNDQHTSLH